VDSLKATLDAREVGQMNPNVRSIVAYNAESERIPTMKFNGILLAQTTPQGGLVSGTSSVVQLDAWNWEDAAVKTDDAVHVNWPARSRLQFDLGTFMVSMKKDKDFAGKDNALANNLVLVTGAAVKPVVDFVKQQQVPVIVTSVHDLPHQKDASIDEAYALPAFLRQHGIKTGLAYQAGMSASARNLAFTAGTAATYGLNDEQAIKMITLDNAAILGIDDKYGD